jgi:hypothetical protein
MEPDIEGYRRVENPITGRTKYVKGEWTELHAGSAAVVAEALSGDLDIGSYRTLGFVIGIGIGLALGGIFGGASGRSLLIGAVAGGTLGVVLARPFVRLIALLVALAVAGVVLFVLWAIGSTLWNS